MMAAPARIGNAQGFWGDRNDAAAEMLDRQPDLDYLTLDYLAEVSMSIFASQRERDPAAGYARDFIQVVRSLAPYWASGGRCRVIANAGGLDPRACAAACRDAIETAGCRSLRIAAVSGDDVVDLLRSEDASAPPDFTNLDSGASISEIRGRLVTANAYLGAEPIVEALSQGADIVVTGRVADPSLTVAACRHHFGWTAGELDRIAGATVAGHLIECGTQVTGGISTDWLYVPDVAHIGFPIVEVFEDGSCLVTKPPGTGGCVTARTVTEQLVYEIGDPDNYLSPDVTVSFLSLVLEDLGSHCVRVSGARGKPAPASYKVSASYRDGFWAAGVLTIFGRAAETKARRCGEAILQRVREAGFELRDSVVECLGCGDTVAKVAAVAGMNDEGRPRESIETVLRVAVETDAREAAEHFARELMPAITAGPPGTTGYAEGRPRIHSVFRYWPCLIRRDRVQPQVEMLATRATGTAAPRATPPASAVPTAVPAVFFAEPPVPGANPRLRDLAYARSGDKGSNANVAVIAYSRTGWEFLREWLTAERVAGYFLPLEVASVDRFELPNLLSLNFVLHGILRRRLRTDAQGKVLGQALLEMPLPAECGRVFRAGEPLRETS